MKRTSPRAREQAAAHLGESNAGHCMVHMLRCVMKPDTVPMVTSSILIGDLQYLLKTKFLLVIFSLSLTHSFEPIQS